jgi:hypothetical protein
MGYEEFSTGGAQSLTWGASGQVRDMILAFDPVLETVAVTMVTAH